MLGIPVQREALVDDFEDDYWLPFTHFNLADRASAGYSALMARSGARSYHVEIHGWSLRSYGSAYGYAFFATRGAPLNELRLSIFHDSLQDTVPSAADAYAAGITLELLDARYHPLGTFRYLTAYGPSQNAGRCSPTPADVVLARAPPIGSWMDVGRNPAADFPQAAWRSAVYVKVAVGFLCAAGLTGAAYSIYFDDFALETGSGDSDGDGISDLEEETRLYAVQMSFSQMPVPLPAQGEVNVTIDGPQVAGLPVSGFVAVDLVHPRPSDLSVSLVTSDGTTETPHLLWDPGFHARGAAILSPSPNQVLRGTVPVKIGISGLSAGGWVHLFADGAFTQSGSRGDGSALILEWRSDAWPEGAHLLRVVVSESQDPLAGGTASAEVPVIVDRTAPDLVIQKPRAHSEVEGLLRVEAGASDASGVAAVELWIDGGRVDVREREPYAFTYETADLRNGRHRIEVRAYDGAGNGASRSVQVAIENEGNHPPKPCRPTCTLPGGTTVGNLPPRPSDTRALEVNLASGDRLVVHEGFQSPWRPEIVSTADGVALVFDVFRDPLLPETEGLVGSSISFEDFARSTSWRILVHDHGSGLAGFVQQASVRFVVRTSPVLADTDGDGLRDGDERLASMVPILADLDGDGLSDGWEMQAHTVTFLIDGAPQERVVRTDPLNPDSDGDGLSDGEELFPGEGRNATDPTTADSDADGLADGMERYRYGTDPTRSDTDGDGLSDGFEVTPHELALVVDGITQVRSVVTSPVLADTDGDGLRDGDEWNGAALVGFATDPSDPDTDHDGLSDGDELAGRNRRPTNPASSDTDGDGVSDGVDLSPTELWNLPWRDVYEPGLVRFTQRYHVLDVHGTSATVWTYKIDTGGCVFLADHTADATKSSVESSANVLATIQKMFADGGELNVTALNAAGAGLSSWGMAVGFYGACSVTAPRQYRFEYRHDDHLYDVDFANVRPMRIRDDAGDPFYHAAMDITVVPSVSQTVVLQLSMAPGADRGGSDGTSSTVPALVYSLHRDADFSIAPPFYRNLAVGATLEDHAYQFTLRIPSDAASPWNLRSMGGQVGASLVITPVWLTTDGQVARKSALNVTFAKVASMLTQRQESAELLIAKLAVDMSALEAALPPDGASLGTGYYTAGGYSVYRFHLGDTYDAQASALADAVYLTGGTAEEVENFQTGIDWTPRADWVRTSQDGFGLTLGVLKVLRRGVSLTSQVTAGMVAPLLAMPSGAMERMEFAQSGYVITKLTDLETGRPYYVIGETSAATIKIQVPHPEVPGVVLTETRTLEREIRGEIVDDLDKSTMLTGVKYAQLKAGLRGAAIGATVAIFGAQAILAFRDGDVIAGSIYAVAGVTSIFGLVKSDIPLVKGLFKGPTLGSGIKIRLGVVAAVAVGALLAAYDLFLAGQTDDAILKLSRYESAGSTIADTLIGVIPLYGPAAMIAWQLGLGIVIAVQRLVGNIPNALAVHLVSSPGNAVVFLFQYSFTTDIPSEVSRDALIGLLNSLADIARLNNCLNPAVPTILLVP